MNDYVVYHNPAKMEYSALQVNALSIVTNKSAAGAIGARVWLITGEGRPKQFSLRGIFTVDAVGRSDNPHFKVEVSGRAGRLFDPMLRLDGEDWFAGFKHTQGNFAFGFNSIGDPRVVRGLVAVAARAS